MPRAHGVGTPVHVFCLSFPGMCWYSNVDVLVLLLQVCFLYNFWSQ